MDSVDACSKDWKPEDEVEVYSDSLGGWQVAPCGTKQPTMRDCNIPTLSMRSVTPSFVFFLKYVSAYD